MICIICCTINNVIFKLCKFEVKKRPYRNQFVSDYFSWNVSFIVSTSSRHYRLVWAVSFQDTLKINKASLIRIPRLITLCHPLKWSLEYLPYMTIKFTHFFVEKIIELRILNRKKNQYYIHSSNSTPSVAWWVMSPFGELWIRVHLLPLLEIVTRPLLASI
jgi:hypothetical protein